LGIHQGEIVINSAQVDPPPRGFISG
jgi:hypothetical protein